MNPLAEGGILLLQTKHYLWLLAFILVFSSFTFPNDSFAASPYKIEINKATNHLYLYKNNQVIKIFRVGTGKEKSLTPEGLFTIGSRAENPVWRDSENNRIVPGGHKDNPLGKFWLGIKVSQNDRAQTYGIHGTNDESTIPGHVSKGCIRMKNADIQLLYTHYKIPVGTPVWIHNGTSTQKWLDNKPKEEPKEESKEEPKKEEIKEISGKIITTSIVNIRQGLSTSTAILNKVEKDTILTVTGETSGWYRINFNGKIGFIAKNYAKRFEETANLQQRADSNTNPAVQSLQANIKTSLTKEESLKIEVSLSNAKEASGTWKITLNNQTIVNEKSEQTTYTHVHKNPKLDSKQIKMKVEFNGTIDGKKVNGAKEVTYNKVEEKMIITPTFKNNLFHLEASLKGNQKAQGIWIIQLGETKSVIPQSGEKLNETFDQVTFKKNQLFPVSVEFKGFYDTSFVIANYEKKLKVNLPKVNLDQTGSQANVEENDENEDNDQTVSNIEDSNKNSTKEQSDNQNNGSKDIANGSQETEEKVVAYNGVQIDSSTSGKVVSAKDEKSNEEKNEDEESSGEEESAKQQGGKLPKTATNYPIGILFGFVMIIVGIWMIWFVRADRAS